MTDPINGKLRICTYFNQIPKNKIGCVGIFIHLEINKEIRLFETVLQRLKDVKI